MSQVDININEAVVTAVREFNNFKGYGVDYYIEAQSNYCTVYLQIVLYDNIARRNSPYIHVGDYVRVSGILKDKPYTKKDGTVGHSLLIERPVSFSKVVSGNSKPQLPQNGSDTALQEQHERTTSQDKPEVSHYEDISGRSQYPPATPEDELPF